MTTLTIAQLTRRTGITARTLRFYETIGLLTAQRTAAGQRCYGPAEMARLHQISALKKAGFTLSDIDGLLSARLIAAEAVIATQLAALERQVTQLGNARSRLVAAQTRLKDGAGLTPEDFCDLINEGERIVTSKEQWGQVTSRYFSAEDQAHWAERMKQVPADFHQEDYAAKWADLGARIKADLPMDPASAKARAYLAEWQALLAPFTAVADAKMMQQSVAFYERMDEWQGDASPGFDSTVWKFIRDVAVLQKAQDAGL